MTYKPWKNPQPIHEEENVRTVRGTTAQMMGDNAGSQRADHAHGYQFEVTMDGGVPMVAGQTDDADGHTHSIIDPEKTEPADDGHFHLLPPEAQQEYPGTGAGAKAEGFDLLKALDGDSRVLGEWLAGIIEKPATK